MTEVLKNTLPSQYTVFKGKSALRMQLQKPEKIEEKYKTGCVFLQVAPLKEQKGDTRIYNWEDKKISIKLGVNDISNIIYGFRSGEDISLFHQFGGETKTISIARNPERGGYFFAVQSKDEKGGGDKISVPISSQETLAMLLMFEAALPLIHNWY